MNVGELCSREVIIVGEKEALAEAAREMGKRHVGAVVVVEQGKDTVQPIGILTDRDLIRGQVDRKADLFCLTVGDVMTRRPLVLNEECDVADAIDRMSAAVVRRAPVVDKQGNLVGIITFDDLLPAIADQLASLARLIGNQAGRERTSQQETYI